MVFSSITFVFIFLPLVLTGYYIFLRKTTWRNYWLLAASLVFYAWGEPLYVFLMLFSIACNYFLGLWLGCTPNKRLRQLILILAVTLNLGILFYFKYFDFFIRTVNSAFHLNLNVGSIPLPIGISFFTFQALSYVIDVYRGTAKVQKNPCHLALYIAFFPQLIAGPIVRYNSIEQQIVHRTVSLDTFQEGIFRFIQGFGKKILLSNVMSITAERFFALAGQRELSVLSAWLGALAYTFQIFFDFSGYSDMAIGLGKMFGFKFEENFRYPYLSRSISEFWNRWHISLGHWFRDYVYFPLGGSRVGKGRLLRNLFVVWLLTGIWHGAAWQFIFWGIGYGVIISIEKLTNLPRKLQSAASIFAYRVFTLLVVVCGWVLFGSSGFQNAFYQIGAMFGIGAVGFCDTLAIFTIREYGIYFLLSAIFSTPLCEKINGRIKKNTVYYIGGTAVYMAILLLSISFLLIDAHNPFIYFNF
ncbi:MAG: MBOAT family protein [Oscillospiraceae bacterium]|nr:MBOAT family protein [Oscillospiraceae bacterium]